MIKVLKIRALFEDYGNGVLKDRDLVEAIEIIREADSFRNAQPQNLKAIKALKKQASSKEEKKDARKTLKEAVLFNQNIEISKFVNDEMNRFNTSHGKAQLEEARKTVAAGYEAIYNFNSSALAEAKALPKRTKEEKDYRKDAIAKAKDFN